MTNDRNSPPPPVSRAVDVIRRGLDGVVRRTDFVAEEVAVELRYSGTTYAVMMATPADLEDFAVGFSLTERIAPAGLSDIRRVDIESDADGIVLDTTLQPSALAAFLALGRARARPGHAGCGICGTSDREAALAPAEQMVPDGTPISAEAIGRALSAMEAMQIINRETHAVHAAAWADPDGTVRLVREDVGRHNALDKLIGAGLRTGVDFANGICVLTSRCSFEMAQKASIAGMPVLAAISAPTALAIRTADAAGLTLIGFARGAALSAYAGAWRIPELTTEPASPGR
jgi:FdhD protein